MVSVNHMAAPSKTGILVGRVISGLVILFTLMDAVGKFAKPPQVVEGTVKLGFDAGTITPLGFVLAVCTVLYTIPRTSVLGAILLTGFFGGAVAANLRAGMPAFNIAFSVIFGVLTWGGLYLRDQRVRDLIPLRSRPTPQGS